MTDKDNQMIALAAVNIAFYILAIPATLYVTWKMGVGRSSGWYYIAILVLLRLVGEPMVIATGGTLDYNNTVSVVGYSLSTVGLSPLLLAAGGFVLSFNRAIGPSFSRIPTQATRLWAIVPLVALILSITGNVKLAQAQTPSDLSSAESLRHAATALYILTYIVLLLMTLLSVSAARHPSTKDLAAATRPLMFAVIPALPLIAVRVIYQCLTTLGSAEDQLSNSQSVFERAFLDCVEEWLCVTIFLAAGVYVARNVMRRGERAYGNGNRSGNGNGHGAIGNGMGNGQGVPAGVYGGSAARHERGGSGERQGLYYHQQHQQEGNGYDMAQMTGRQGV